MKHPSNRKERLLINEKKKAGAKNADSIRRKLREQAKEQETTDELRGIRDGNQP